jgi:hypothetical protein
MTFRFHIANLWRRTLKKRSQKDQTTGGPDPDEVQAVLDVLFNSRRIRVEYELQMRVLAKRYSPPKINPFSRKLPKRLHVLHAKHEFEREFRDIVRVALEQVKEVRKGKKAIDIFPVSANVVFMERPHGGPAAVEIFMGTAGFELVEGFGSYVEACNWIKNEAQAYVEKKGLPRGTKVFHVGESDWESWDSRDWSSPRPPPPRWRSPAEKMFDADEEPSPPPPVDVFRKAA